VSTKPGQPHHNAAAIEALTQRLDAGFQLLAQPFLQGIPSMEVLARASEALKKTAEEVAQADIVQLTTRLDLAVTRLDRVLDDLPPRVSAGIHQAASAIRAATQEGARAGMESSLAPVASDIQGLAAGLSERMKDATTMVAHLAQARSTADDNLRNHLEAAVVVPLLEGVKTLSNSIATLEAEARRLMTLDTPQLQVVQHTLDVMAARLAESLSQEGHTLKELEQVRKLLLVIQSALAGVRTEASPPNRTGWWRR
jgi:phage-related protein